MRLFRSELGHPAAGATTKVEDVQSFDLGQKSVEEAFFQREHRVGLGVIDRRRQAIAISRRDACRWNGRGGPDARPDYRLSAFGLRRLMNWCAQRSSFGCA